MNKIECPKCKKEAKMPNEVDYSRIYQCPYCNQDIMLKRPYKEIYINKYTETQQIDLDMQKINSEEELLKGSGFFLISGGLLFLACPLLGIILLGIALFGLILSFLSSCSTT